MSSPTMLAARYIPGNVSLSLEHVARPKPAPGEVLLRILACGVCHTDVHVLDSAGKTFWRESFIMGHEVCGEAVELGDDAHAELGALYCVHAISAKKADGDSQTSVINGGFGVGRDGGYAEYTAVPQDALVRVPQGIPPAVAAVAADAAVTAYHAASNVRTGDRVLVVGVGGLGLMGVKIAVLRGAKEVMACDLREHARGLAVQAGATRSFTPEELAASIADGTLIVDIVLDFVSTAITFHTGRDALRKVGAEPGGLGRHVIVGIGNEDVTMNLTDLLISSIQIIPSVYGSKEDLAQVLELINQKKLVIEVEHFPLKDVNIVLDNLRKGTIRSRAVLIPPDHDATKDSDISNPQTHSDL